MPRAGIDEIVATHSLKPPEVHGGRLAVTRLPHTPEPAHGDHDGLGEQ